MIPQAQKQGVESGFHSQQDFATWDPGSGKQAHVPHYAHPALAQPPPLTVTDEGHHAQELDLQTGEAPRLWFANVSELPGQAPLKHS